MLKKVEYYIDTLSRFNSKQLFYLFKNRVIKKLFPILNLKDDAKALEYLPFNIFINNAKKFINVEEDASPIWIWDSELSPSWQHKYFNELQSSLKKRHLSSTKTDSSLTIIWKKNPYHLEINNNFQRFHLFHENFDECSLDLDSRLKIILNWINLNLPKSNLGWNSFNCTIRLLNWLKVLTKIPDNYIIEDDLWEEIQKSIYVQTIFISNNIEYHIPGNHVLIQLIVLSIISKLFPSWFAENAIISKIDNKVKDEILKQFTNDGFHFEHSNHYHLQLTLFSLIWLHFMLILKHNVNEKVIRRIKRADFLVKKFNLPDGSIPMLGDNCFSFLTKNSFEDVSLCAKLAMLNQKETLSVDNNNGVTVIKNHYHIIKSGKSKIIFDIGNIGLLNNPGHGHSDLLSIIYAWNYQPIFIDPGTRKYSNENEDLALKRSVLHNTISINKCDQAKLWGFFRWAKLPSDVISSYNITENGFVCIGEYYGFKHIGGYKHRRELVLEKDNFFIKDSIQGRKTDAISLNFILHQDIDCEKNDAKVNLLKNGKAILEMKINSKLNSIIIIENTNIYPIYDVSINSKLIRIKFSNVDFPFENTVSISPYEKLL
ncbi:MAG: heparinase II/III family protein [Ignavibacteria bacterium]|nr:heparinase II/III family protein [Ignavibacteria bacterium]